MSLAIAGMGWVTPLGHDVDSVWEQLLRGHAASATKISEQFGDRLYSVFRVPEWAMAGSAHPRLRRASAISRFAAAAGLDAIKAAGVKLDSEKAERTALVFAISNGGVIYTKRFYRDIVEAGAQKASPLLFPETVFNAPASHLAAILGITSATYTLVGDGAVGLAAIKMADDLLANEAVDCCLVVGMEGSGWLESVGAAGLWQVVLAAQALRHAELPPVLHAHPGITLRLSLSRTPMAGARRAIVLSCGLNQQAAGLRLAIQC